MNMSCITEDRIRFADLIKHVRPKPKHMAPKHTEPRQERYPKDQNEFPVYTEIPLYYKADDETPTNEVKAYMYVLSCPICGRRVKRKHIFCKECGNKLI